MVEGGCTLLPVVLDNGIVALAPQASIELLKPRIDEDSEMVAAVLAVMKRGGQTWPTRAEKTTWECE
jgi:hypothetical protein